MRLIPYLYFKDNAEEVLHFYKDVLDGQITTLQRFKEGPSMGVSEERLEKILHACLQFSDNELLYFSDSMNGEVDLGNNMSLTLDLDSEEAITTIYNKLSDGGKIKMPLDDTFWGAKFASLEDKFGIQWSLNYTLPQA